MIALSRTVPAHTMVLSDHVKASIDRFGAKIDAGTRWCGKRKNEKVRRRLCRARWQPFCRDIVVANVPIPEDPDPQPFTVHGVTLDLWSQAGFSWKPIRGATKRWTDPAFGWVHTSGPEPSSAIDVRLD